MKLAGWGSLKCDDAELKSSDLEDAGKDDDETKEQDPDLGLEWLEHKVAIVFNLRVLHRLGQQQRVARYHLA